ncbi:uncharacterized protein LOC142620631 [Castanea sativa]|uniref:uncharacterized protein LOC142620631 n=1 Tax=Castanea sativa TaxID=21020 RepID=UPI003F64D7F0
MGEQGQRWSFVDVVWQIVRCESVLPSLLEKVAAICWGIWKNRCEVQHGGHRRSSRDIARNSLVSLEEFQAANKLAASPIVKENIKWSPPALGRYKLNVDGAVFSQIKTTGLGMVIHDDAGLVVAAMSKISIPLGPLEAEAKAIEAAIQFAIDIGIREFTFETDSLLLFNALQGTNAAASSIVNIVSGILFQSQNFRSVNFSHIKRLGNMPAHALAQHAKHVVDFVTWLEETPCLIERMCAQDVINLSLV